jgi:hypothetical protein
VDFEIHNAALEARIQRYPAMEEDQLRLLRLERLREDIREGLESGPSTEFDPKEIKVAGREWKSRKGKK